MSKGLAMILVTIISHFSAALCPVLVIFSSLRVRAAPGCNPSMSDRPATMLIQRRGCRAAPIGGTDVVQGTW